MLGTLESPPRRESRSSRIARLLARRRNWIFTPLFLAAIALAFLRPTPVRREVMLGAVAVVLASWLLRVWATGYRTWVHTSGVSRYLMSAGPYAYVRHPLYVANGLSGAAALAALGQVELLAVYTVGYLAMTALIVLREEDALSVRFGAEHAGYRERVPAFCPWLRRSMPAAERQGRFSWDPVRRSFEVWKLAGIALVSAWFVLRSST